MKTKYKIHLAILILLSLLILAGCGSRKATISTYKANVTTKEQSATKLDSTASAKQEVKEKETVKQVEQKDITQKDVKVEVKEVFTPDGALVERTTTTTTSDKVDRTKNERTKERTKQTNTLNEVAKKLSTTANKVVDSLIKEKNKEVTSKKGIGLWWILIIVVLAGFAWYWLKK